MRPRRSGPASRIYRAMLYLLPVWLRDRAGDEMLETFEARIAASRGTGERAREIALELLGLLRVAVVAHVLETPPAFTPALQHAHTGSSMLDTLGRDLRFALRSMRRDRATALLAVLTLALGVGTSSAMFSMIDSVLLRPLPFVKPEQIVLVNPTIEEWRNHPTLHHSWRNGNFSAPELAAWLEGQRSFQAAGGYARTSARVPSGEGSERVPIVHATTGVFEALGVRPLYGRLPDAVEPEPVVVLTHSYFRTRHGADPSILGRDIRINERPVRVIGVLPPEFQLVGVEAELWRPLTVNASAEGLGNHSFLALGRLREDVAVAQAEQELARLVAGPSEGVAGHVTHGGNIISPVKQATERVRGPLLILASASLILLLAACANVALLLVGAGADRVRELAVRQALGAPKSRIALQLLVESVVIAVLGAAAGLLVAVATVRFLVALSPDGIPRMDGVGIDLRTFGFAALLAVVTGVLVGCFPALSLTWVDAAAALRAGAATPGRGRLQRAIVVAELAFATVLLVGGGLLTRTMHELQRVEPGFDAEGLLSVQLTLPWDRFYRSGVSSELAGTQMRAYLARLLEEVRTTPGVESVALSSDMPYSGDRGTNPVEPEGYEPAPGEVIDAARRFVSGNYFEVMRIPALEGRLISSADDRPDAERVMVVSDRFAKRFWPDGRWLNRRVVFWNETYRVIGVIADTREHDLRGDTDALKFYVPDRGERNLGDNLLIRASIPAGTMVPALRARIWSVDRSIVIADAMPMRERIAGTLAEDRYRTRLMVAFSAMAALFSLLGVYGVMNRAVARRRREIGMRVALGAQRGRILSLVLGEAGRIGALGALLGVAGALLATRVMENLVWGVPRLDPVTYAGAAVVLLALTLAAALAPAHRAAGVEPIRAIRG